LEESREARVLGANNQGVQALVVDADPKLSDVLRNVLTLDGYEVLSAAAGRRAIAMAVECVPDAILLERNLPDIDGLAVCRRLRRLENRVPILMFGVGDAVSDRVSGLEAGADHYMVKPFSVLELRARVRALIRRARLNGGRQAVELAKIELEFAELQLDRTNHGVLVAGRFTGLTPTEYQLLELFMRNPDRLLTHSVIHESVWGYDNANAAKLRVYIGYLRRKLGDLGARRLIHTVPRRGYIMREP
jgi:two-component system, OmpR family, response regulator MprA